MRRHRLFILGGIVFLPIATTGWSCSDDKNITGNTVDSGVPQPQNDAGSTDAAATGTDAGSITLIVPGGQNVPTCSSIQLEQGPVGPYAGTWSVSLDPDGGAVTPGGGTISQAGFYTSPTQAPADSNVLIQFTQTSPVVTVSAQYEVATAFVGAQAFLPIGTDNNLATGAFEHQFVANGSTVYAILPGPNNELEADVYASTDNGVTFAGPTHFHTGALNCAGIAVDPANPKLVYVYYFGGIGDTTSNGTTLRVAVSTDGAQTFPKEYDIFDGSGSMPSFLCPDISAPSAGHVIVAGANGVVAGESAWDVATFVSSNNGVGLGPASTEGTQLITDGGTGSIDTNGVHATGSCTIGSNSNDNGPRIISNGQGLACLVYRYGPACSDAGSSAALVVQCSQDSGATWDAPQIVAYPPSTNDFYPTGAISPNGTIAVAWLNSDTPTSAFDAYIAISKDKGATFGAPVHHPDIPGDYDTYLPVLAWENDDVLWLEAYGHSNTPFAWVDKTCDLGATWSGAVTLGRGINPNGLLRTSLGMVAAGTSTSPKNQAFTIPLYGGTIH